MGLQELIQFADTETRKEVQAAVVAQSVVDLPDANERMRPLAPIVFNIAQQADDFIPWGYNLSGRDFQLRGFWPTEPALASAVSTMATRMAALEWYVDGAVLDKPRPKRTIATVTNILKNAERGRGWAIFMTKLMIDLYSQDNGSFFEKIRLAKDPRAPVVGIAHLDASSCERTGDPEIPVLYTDRKGRQIKMPWWAVEDVTDMPSPVEGMYGAQYCAVTRALRNAQVIRDIMLYKKEKVSGQHTRALHLVKGFTRANIEQALALSREVSLNQGMYRYSQPIIVPAVDMEGTIQHVQIDLASLPDGFDEETTWKWYIALLALAFGVDYQEFAPLPSGALGSGQQSEILHFKSGAKGPAMIISQLEHIFNDNGILPRIVKLKFRVQDARSDAEAARARYERGRDRSLRIDSGELDMEGARRLAVLDGDLTEDLYEQMQARGVPKPEDLRERDPNTIEQIQGGIESQKDQVQRDGLETDLEDEADDRPISRIKRLMGWR